MIVLTQFAKDIRAYSTRVLSSGIKNDIPDSRIIHSGCPEPAFRAES